MHAQRTLAATVAVAALVMMSTQVAAQEAGNSLRFSTGIEYSSGKYGGTDDIEEIYVPFTVRFGLDRVGFRLTVPYLAVDAPPDAIITDDGAEPLPDGGTSVTETGLGDVIGAITLYDLFVSDSGNFVADVTGKIKLATADEDRGLGTGENDYTLQLDGYRFFDNFTLQGAVGYRWRGSPPGIQLNDVMLGSIGGAYAASANTIVGMYFDYRQSAISGADDIQELSGFASFRLGRAWRMDVYAFTGLTDSSTDFGGGVLFSTDLSQLRVSERQDY